MWRRKSPVSRRKFLRLPAGLVVVASLGLVILWALSRGGSPIPVLIDTPTRPKDIIVKTQLPNDFIFRQDDQRWGGEFIGETQDSLKAYGCTISSVAMAISNLTGEAYTPQALNTDLFAIGGFTDRGWLIWDSISKVTDNKISPKYYKRLDHDDINTCMAGGNYPIVKIYLNDSYVHWVLILGTTESDYIIRDPLFGHKDEIEFLSDTATEIHAVRCVSRTQ